ncbi:DNA-directed RNA polymerase I subunit rpa49 [Pseudocyphellaria aurata]|nr:DNA-directed RNA polymerase I subunit rpa49 [Pseudocyphellaria aurata]
MTETKKRKRSHAEHQERPAKRVAFDSSTAPIKVSFVSEVEEWVPVVATSPGLTFPAGMSLKPYKKLRRNSQRSSEILLHSAAAQSKIDYTVQYQESNSTESLLNHYIGIYDPETQHIQLVPARAATIRGTPRSDTVNESGAEEDPASIFQLLSARSNLGLAFGTKKARKAIRAITENAISPSKHLTQPSSSQSVLDPAAAAVLDLMKASATSALAQEEIKQAAEDAKPGPKPNLQAKTVAEVYPLEEVVGLDTLKSLTVRDWQDNVRDGADVVTSSRYVSGRLVQVVKSEEVRKIKALKYLLLLVQWYHCFKPGTKRVPKLGPKKNVEAVMKGTSEELRNRIKERFSEDNMLNKWHTSNLHLYICTLALIIDDFATDVYDLSQDLRLEPRQIRTLFTHLGSTFSRPTAAQLDKLSLTKAQASGHGIARLVFPLKFLEPKISRDQKRRR